MHPCQCSQCWAFETAEDYGRQSSCLGETEGEFSRDRNELNRMIMSGNGLREPKGGEVTRKHT